MTDRSSVFGASFVANSDEDPTKYGRVGITRSALVTLSRWPLPNTPQTRMGRLCHSLACKRQSMPLQIEGCIVYPTNILKESSMGFNQNYDGLRQEQGTERD